MEVTAFARILMKNWLFIFTTTSGKESGGMLSD